MTTEKTIKWQREHPERVKAHKKKYYEAHRAELLEKQHQYYLRRKALKEAKKHDGNLRTDQEGE